METALVTGAAGFIGSHLVDALLERGHAVRGIDDLSTGRRRNLEGALGDGSFEFVEADIADEAAVSTAVEGVDVVFHQAALASVPRSFEDPRSTTRTNCLGTATLLAAASEASVETVVTASSSAIYGPGDELPKQEDMAPTPESPYALSKHFAEQLTLQAGRHYGLHTVALRYFNVYGPRQPATGGYPAVIPAFIERIRREASPTVYGDGEQTRDFVYVADVVRANLAAAASDAGDGTYNVGRGHAVSVNELLESVQTVMGTDRPPDHEAPRPGDVRHSVADVSKARRELGFEATIDLEEGLRRTVEWYDAEGGGCRDA